MDALTKLRQRNRLHVQLKSGLSVAYHLPDIKLCIVEAEELEGASTLRKTWAVSRYMVAQMLDAIEGDEITGRDDRLAIVDLLTPDERRELAELAAPVPPEGEQEQPQDWGEAAAANELAWLAGSPAAAEPQTPARIG